MTDIHQPGDYRIILGDSLKSDDVTTSSVSSHLAFKYNWLPKDGLNHTPGTMEGSDDNLRLSYRDGTERYDYTGWLSEQSDHVPQLALFYDKDRSAYVLEKLTASFDMNIKSGSNIQSVEVKRLAQLPRPHTVVETNGNHTNDVELLENEQDDDEAADHSNPFDYRNFLTEAEEAAEKVTYHPGGGRTPLPGGRTPISGLSSPLTGNGHPFSNTTPQFAPIEIIASKNRMDSEYPDRRKRQAAKGTKAKTQRKIPSSSKSKAITNSSNAQVLSEARVIDSDSDDNSSDDISDRPSLNAAPAKRPAKTHRRNVSSISAVSAASSSHKVVDGGDLEIEDSSPQPRKPKRGPRINPNKFGSRTDSPFLGETTDADIIMQDADAEEDENMKYFQDDDDEDEDEPDRSIKDGDVDELVLDQGVTKSPTPPPALPTPPLPTIHAPKPNRRKNSTSKSRRNTKPKSPPHLPHSDDLEDDDGGLAAELEAALEEQQQEQESKTRRGGDDDEEDGGVGLGIGLSGRLDDDSEISEEE